MTIFDLLFLLLFLAGLAALIAAFAFAVSGKRAFAAILLRRLAFCIVSYLAVVYIATAFSALTVLHLHDAQCNDDWCIAVDGMKRTPNAAMTRYQVTLRVFSRALRRAQRENIAADVYLVDAGWKRYDPILDGSEIPLNTLLQPGESVTTIRRFELPVNSHEIGLRIDRRAGPAGPPVCWIIGECTAFHKGTVIRID